MDRRFAEHVASKLQSELNSEEEEQKIIDALNSLNIKDLEVKKKKDVNIPGYYISFWQSDDEKEHKKNIASIKKVLDGLGWDKEYKHNIGFMGLNDGYVWSKPEYSNFILPTVHYAR